MGEAAKKEDEEKSIPVGPGADDLPEEKEKEAEPEDKRLAQSDEDEREDDEKSDRKKESSKERRDRAKKSRARDRAELDVLRRENAQFQRQFVERFAAMETRQAQTETAAIDSRINTINGQIASARRVMADSLKHPNGTGSEQYEEALKIYDELRDQLSELKSSKKTYQQHAAREQLPVYEASGDDKPDPRVIRNARKWAANHDWFSFDGEDEDSRVVHAIDKALAGDGFDPTEDDYWEELTARVKRRLPERFKKDARARPDDDEDALDEDEDRGSRASGPKFSSGGRERPLKKGEVYVSAERKQAMKEYGVWDDPAARNRMLKKYAQWDAEIAASNKR